MAELQAVKVVCKCPQCGTGYRVPVGKTAKCPKCAVPLEAPAAPSTASPQDSGTPGSKGRASPSGRLKSPGALRNGAGTAGKRSSARLGAGERPSGNLDRRASSGRMKSEGADRPGRGERPTRAKKGVPVIPITVGGVIVLVLVVGVFVMNQKGPADSSGATGGGAPTAEGPPYPAFNAPEEKQPEGPPDPWAPGSANYKPPEKEIDWSKDDSKETEMQKRRKAGFKGELPPESYGQDPKDTPGRPLAGDRPNPPPNSPPPAPETPPAAPK